MPGSRETVLSIKASLFLNHLRQKEGENPSCISKYWEKQSCIEAKSQRYKSSLEARQRSHKRPVSLQREAGEKSETRLRVTTKVAINGENQS